MILYFLNDRVQMCISNTNKLHLIIFLLLSVVSNSSAQVLKEWAWAGGSKVKEQSGNYGKINVAAPSNFPGGRRGASSWIDLNNQMYLFGGFGVDGAGNQGLLNDLWKFNGKEWIWVSGSEKANQNSHYGVQLEAGKGFPGGREDALSWIDSKGDLWLFGGFGYNAAGKKDFLNDLWKYSDDGWIWISGDKETNQSGKYGMRGRMDLASYPGSRSRGVSWVDLDGNFWLFGGVGYDGNGQWGRLNDLWMYKEGGWTWVEGSKKVNDSGFYGTQNIPSPNNNPGGRFYSVGWIDHSGNLLLFGGYGKDEYGNFGRFNDLWKYNGSHWTFVSGSQSVKEMGIYENDPIFDLKATPGAREGAVGCIDSQGNFWLFGGMGYDGMGAEGSLNDLWKFNSENWDWISGSFKADQFGSYSFSGMSAALFPGGRGHSVSWVDLNGTLWLFGGKGADSKGEVGILGDFWKIDLSDILFSSQENSSTLKDK